MTFMNGGEGFRGLCQTLPFPNILSSGCQERASKYVPENLFLKQNKSGLEKEKDTKVLPTLLKRHRGSMLLLVKNNHLITPICVTAAKGVLIVKGKDILWTKVRIATILDQV